MGSRTSAKSRRIGGFNLDIGELFERSTVVPREHTHHPRSLRITVHPSNDPSALKSPKRPCNRCQPNNAASASDLALVFLPAELWGRPRRPAAKLLLHRCDEGVPARLTI